MKIRTGFVSNSSSSSFLCLVEKDVFKRAEIPDVIRQFFINYADLRNYFGKDVYFVSKYFDGCDTEKEDRLSILSEIENDFFITNPNRLYGGKSQAACEMVAEICLALNKNSVIIKTEEV